MNPDLARLLPRFEPILLQEIGQAELPRRYDTEYALPGSALPALLEGAGRRYRILEVAGRRLAPHETIYYDTPGLELYHAHYERRFPRAKIRVRTYENTGTRFLETKVRESPRWSTKERWALDVRTSHLMVDPAALPPLEADRGPLHLVPVVTVTYRRLTLVGLDPVERVSVDVAVCARREGEVVRWPSAVIVEVKQPAPGPSPLAETLASLGVRARELSKYCLGIAATGNGVPTDRFRPLVRHLEQIGSEHDDMDEG